MLASSTSDSASAQKRLNKLIEQQKEADYKLFGSATKKGFSIIENFCAMHLGTNLRKAFLDGIRSLYDQNCESGQRDYHTVDVAVHEFCKVFGEAWCSRIWKWNTYIPRLLSIAVRKFRYE